MATLLAVIDELSFQQKCWESVARPLRGLDQPAPATTRGLAPYGRPRGGSVRPNCGWLHTADLDWLHTAEPRWLRTAELGGSTWPTWPWLRLAEPMVALIGRSVTRKTYATIIATAGNDVSVVNRLLRHSAGGRNTSVAERHNMGRSDALLRDIVDEAFAPWAGVVAPGRAGGSATTVAG